MLAEATFAAGTCCRLGLYGSRNRGRNGRSKFRHSHDTRGKLGQKSVLSAKSAARPMLSGLFSVDLRVRLRSLATGVARMARLRRGGYIFVTWTGDHPPPHVHVYRNRRLVVKWDLENQTAIKGAASRRLRKLIAILEAEGLL